MRACDPGGWNRSSTGGRLLPLLVLSVASLAPAADNESAAARNVRTEFHVKYVAEGAVYIDGGRSAGLSERMRLTVRGRSAGAAVAELVILSVADSSAVCEMATPAGTVQAGDAAILSSEDTEKIAVLRSAGDSARYAQVIAFSDGDPIDEEVRERVPHPPLPEINRVRGRVGFEYNAIRDRNGSGLNSSDFGMVFRADMTRIAGTHWNLSGYTHFRANRQSGPQIVTLNDLLNRTYQLTLFYNNPDSRWVLGFGRFYLPWAPSLSAIDGGYAGFRAAKKVTVGLFAGSSPDPTSWNYKPGRQMMGEFVNFEGGDWDTVHYSSTLGVALTRLSWKPERQFLFTESNFNYRRYFSVYHSMQADKLNDSPQQQPGATGGAALTRSFLTVRFEPARFVTFDINHNYFRDFPTFDPRLVGTGLLDQLLFQGVSGGVRLHFPYKVSLYTDLGRSSRSGDARASLNQLYGAAVSDILHTGFRADVRYSRFDSVFGRGTYKAVSASRELGENLRFELQAGQQNFGSVLTAQSRSRYINGNLDWFFSAHYFLGGGLTVYRGQSQNYDQTFFNLGYRF